MRHLFSLWPEVAGRLREARQVLLLTDFDGTLAPIVERPELAELPEGTARLLQELARRPGFMIGVISGRALADLKERARLDNVTWAGNHGLEIEGAGLSFIDPVAEEVKPLLRLLHRVLSQALIAIKGAFVENKGLTLSVHYRLVDDDRLEDVRSTVEGVVGASRGVGKVRTTIGKKVYEIRPAVEWDKGKAIQLLVDRHSRGGRRLPLVIFLGDDTTDEDGFRVVAKNSGIAIFVGEESARSSANYFLRSPWEVQTFLQMVLEAREGKEQ